MSDLPSLADTAGKALSILQEGEQAAESTTVNDAYPDFHIEPFEGVLQLTILDDMTAIVGTDESRDIDEAVPNFAQFTGAPTIDASAFDIGSLDSFLATATSITTTAALQPVHTVQQDIQTFLDDINRSAEMASPPVAASTGSNNTAAQDNDGGLSGNTSSSPFTATQPGNNSSVATGKTLVLVAKNEQVTDIVHKADIAAGNGQGQAHGMYDVVVTTTGTGRVIPEAVYQYLRATPFGRQLFAVSCDHPDALFHAYRSQIASLNGIPAYQQFVAELRARRDAARAAAMQPGGSQQTASIVPGQHTGNQTATSSQAPAAGGIAQQGSVRPRAQNTFRANAPHVGVEIQIAAIAGHGRNADKHFDANAWRLECDNCPRHFDKIREFNRHQREKCVGGRRETFRIIRVSVGPATWTGHFVRGAVAYEIDGHLVAVGIGNQVAAGATDDEGEDGDDDDDDADEEEDEDSVMVEAGDDHADEIMYATDDDADEDAD